MTRFRMASGSSRRRPPTSQDSPWNRRTVPSATKTCTNSPPSVRHVRRGAFGGALVVDDDRVRPKPAQDAGGVAAVGREAPHLRHAFECPCQRLGHKRNTAEDRDDGQGGAGCRALGHTASPAVTAPSNAAR